MNITGFNFKVKNSSWVREVAFNGESLTVFTDKGKSFDLLAVSVVEINRVRKAITSGGSVGRAINSLIRVREKDGTLKTDAVPSHVWE